MRVIQEILGHARLTTTQLYTRVSIRLLKAMHTATHPAATLARPAAPPAAVVDTEPLEEPATSFLAAREEAASPLPERSPRELGATGRASLLSWPWSRRLRSRRPRPLARRRRAVATPGSHPIARGLPGYPPKTLFPSSSLVTVRTPRAPPASAALGLIAATRIGADVDFSARLATGGTVGRATTGKALALTHSPRS